MLDKFPANVEPTVWRPQDQFKPKQEMFGLRKRKFNGWNGNLEEEMKEIVGLVRRKDSAEYVRLSNVVLKVNKVLGISGPLLTVWLQLALVFRGPQFSVRGVQFRVSYVESSLPQLTLKIDKLEWCLRCIEALRGFISIWKRPLNRLLEGREVHNRENGELF